MVLSQTLFSYYHSQNLNKGSCSHASIKSRHSSAENNNQSWIRRKHRNKTGIYSPPAEFRPLRLKLICDKMRYQLSHCLLFYILLSPITLVFKETAFWASCLRYKKRRVSYFNLWEHQTHLHQKTRSGFPLAPLDTYYLGSTGRQQDNKLAYSRSRDTGEPDEGYWHGTLQLNLIFV